MLETITKTPLDTLLLSIADDEFILGYRNSEWTGIAPLLEEDVAFSSMAQDEIGHARLLYQMLEERTGVPADKIAYARQPHEFLSCRLMDARRLDWAHATARQFLYDTADHVRLESLTHSSYEPLANATQKIIREEKYHLMHGDMWMARLAAWSDESRQRIIEALDELWPYALGIFEPIPGEDELSGSGIIPTMKSLQDSWVSATAPHFLNYNLPFPPAFNPGANQFEASILDLPNGKPVYGGRRGEHSDEFRQLWEEMTEVYRVAPNAIW